ncbi:MAG: hypothetical protein J3K34DRAFT_140431 [Monoraphidium minutum]|nr:MAG: hypothetical protein J3K34DRAFT_140431 [Monoraphidium minutum]
MIVSVDSHTSFVYTRATSRPDCPVFCRSHARLGGLKRRTSCSTHSLRDATTAGVSPGGDGGGTSAKAHTLRWRAAIAMSSPPAERPEAARARQPRARHPRSGCPYSYSGEVQRLSAALAVLQRDVAVLAARQAALRRASDLRSAQLRHATALLELGRLVRLRDGGGGGGGGSSGGGSGGGGGGAEDGAGELWEREVAQLAREAAEGEGIGGGRGGGPLGWDPAAAAAVVGSNSEPVARWLTANHRTFVERASPLLVRLQLGAPEVGAMEAQLAALRAAWIEGLAAGMLLDFRSIFEYIVTPCDGSAGKPKPGDEHFAWGVQHLRLSADQLDAASELFGWWAVRTAAPTARMAELTEAVAAAGAAGAELDAGAVGEMSRHMAAFAAAAQLTAITLSCSIFTPRQLATLLAATWPWVPSLVALHRAFTPPPLQP